MQTVGIKTLKNKLSEYLRMAAGGETVLVTDRGTVVAEIVPPRLASDTSAEQKWAELVRQGIVTPARASPEAGPPPRRKPKMKLDELLRGLDADRSDR